MKLPKYLQAEFYAGTSAPDGDFHPGDWRHNLDGDLLPPREVSPEQAARELALLRQAWGFIFEPMLGPAMLGVKVHLQ